MPSTPPRKRRVRPVVPEQPNGAESPKPSPRPPEVDEETDAQARAEDEAPFPSSAAAPMSVEDAVVEDIPPGARTVIPPPSGDEAPARQSWSLEVGNKDVGVVLKELRDDVSYWVAKGRYNKVRVTRDGKQLLPDIPVGALLAAEVAGFAWAGALRTAVVNVAGRLLFKVELINDAKEHLEAARQHYTRGDLDEAEAETVRALKVDSRLADGYLLLGTLAKVRGKNDEALRHLQKARDLDPHGDVGREAEAQGRKLDPDFGGGARQPVEKA